MENIYIMAKKARVIVGGGSKTGLPKYSSPVITPMRRVKKTILISNNQRRCCLSCLSLLIKGKYDLAERLLNMISLYHIFLFYNAENENLFLAVRQLSFWNYQSCQVRTGLFPFPHQSGYLPYPVQRVRLRFGQL